MTNKLGYNFTVTSADINYDGRGSGKLTVTIKNTGLAPAFFDINLIAEVTDAEGKRRACLGEPVLIKKGTFADGAEKTYVFNISNVSLYKGE